MVSWGISVIFPVTLERSSLFSIVTFRVVNASLSLFISIFAWSNSSFDQIVFFSVPFGPFISFSPVSEIKSLIARIFMTISLAKASSLEPGIGSNLSPSIYLLVGTAIRIFLESLFNTTSFSAAKFLLNVTQSSN